MITRVYPSFKSAKQRVPLATALFAAVCMSYAWSASKETETITGSPSFTRVSVGLPNQPAHIYIVGCGHSGTSFFLRTISNLPGVMCIPIESAVWLSDHNYIQNTTGPLKPEEESRIRTSLGEWDADAKKAGFSTWVEKTPRHVNHFDRIFTVDPNAVVLFMVRDGRDVALSYMKRGRQFEEAMERWIHDNTAALPYLDDPRVLVIKFEELASFEQASEVMNRIDEFLSGVTGQMAGESRLMMSMLPPATPMGSHKMMCNQYSSEEEKWEDLKKSQLMLMSGQLSSRAGDMPENEDHRRYRTWQMMQPWFAAEKSWPKKMTAQQKKIFMGNKQAVELLKRFDYET